MRLIAGEFRGRRIDAPKGMSTRPTTDRTRESLFNLLASRRPLEGLRVIDLFAGSGALGLEAMSRGASFALFIEMAAPARGAIRTNIESLGLQGRTALFRRDATSLGVPGTMQPFDIAFLDPPYGKGLGEKAIAALVGGGWLKPQALVVLEESADAVPDGSVCSLEMVYRRIWGPTGIAILAMPQS